MVCSGSSVVRSLSLREAGAIELTAIYVNVERTAECVCVHGFVIVVASLTDGTALPSVRASVVSVSVHCGSFQTYSAVT